MSADVADSPDERIIGKVSWKPNHLAACAAHALALRNIIRCQRYRVLEEYEGGVGADAGEESLFWVDLPNGFRLGEIYRSFMDKWLHDAGEGGPAAREVYVDLVTTILVDEMTKADGLCSDDMYHAITLLAALKPALWDEAAKEMVDAERKAKTASNRSTTARHDLGRCRAPVAPSARRVCCAMDYEATHRLRNSVPELAARGSGCAVDRGAVRRYRPWMLTAR